jgi:hypothetical protein
MRKAIVNATIWTLGALIGTTVSAPAPAQQLVKRGEYLATIMDCTGCHTPGALAAYLKNLKPVRHKAPEPRGPSEQPTAPYLTLAQPK